MWLLSLHLPGLWFDGLRLSFFQTDMFNVYIFNCINTWITIIMVMWEKIASLLPITFTLNRSFWHCWSTFEVIMAIISTMVFWCTPIKCFCNFDNLSTFAGNWVNRKYTSRESNFSWLINIFFKKLSVT